MALQRIEFTTPIGRIVAGDLYKAQTKDADGKPLVIKNGPDQGKLTQKFYFGLAIPKIPGAHWSQYPRLVEKPDRMSWGEAVWNAAHQFMANCQQAPKFAFKVTDGDSQQPNGKGNKPCDQEGWRGHWILHCSGMFAPKIYTSDGSMLLVQPDLVRPGYYVQVAGSTVGNESSQNPGVYINPDMIAYRGQGPIINTGGANPQDAGFGVGALPAGAMPPDTTGGGFGGAAPPVQGMAPPPHAGWSPAPGPAAAYAPPAQYAPPPGMAPPPQMPVQPHQTILGAPPPGQYAPFPGAPPAPPPVVQGPVMLPAANGATYAAMRANGWSDEQLRQHGMMA